MTARIASGEGGGSVAEVLSSDVIRELRRQQAEVMRRKADLDSELGPRHPDMISINDELGDIRAQISSETRRIVNNLRNEVEITQGRVAALERALGEAQVQFSVESTSMVRLRELERTAQASRTIYESFLNRFRQTSEQEGIEEADAQIVSYADIPADPSFPNFGLLLVISTGLGLMGGLLLVALLEVFDRGFLTIEDLEAFSGVSVMGVTSKLTQQDLTVDGKQIEAIDHVVAKPLSAFAESFRTLRTALTLKKEMSSSGGVSRSQVIVFTSGLPGEGKTVSSVSFARSAAMADARVVLLDCDLRRKVLTQAIAKSTKNGLVEVLNGTADLDDVIIHDETGCDVVPLSNAKVTAHDVFGSERFAAFLEEMRSRYDFIICDTAPALAISDTLTLARQADSVLVMVKWARTPRNILASVMRELGKVDGTPRPSLMLTQVNRRAMGRYGYGYHSSYAQYYEG